MRIRRDSVFISAVLLTVALLCALPVCLRYLQEAHGEIHQPDLFFGLYLHTLGDLGVASLAIIFIALIVTWAGYARCLRWTWFVMFVVVWGWAFPFLALPLVGPLFKHALTLTFPEVLYGALHGYLYPRMLVKGILIFSLMVIALLLPMKSFFIIKGIRAPSWRLSPRLIGFSVAGILVTAIAFLAWIDFRTYEIPPLQMMWFQAAPPPPPPHRIPSEDWLPLSTDAKYGYVQGYLSGFDRGKLDGCSFHEEKTTAHLAGKPASREKLPRHVCFTSLPYFIDSYTSTYVDTITSYYTKYPNDRKADIESLLDQMAKPSGLTDIDQIHERLTGETKGH